MTIQLKASIFIAGVHQAAGTSLTLGADVEAELVNRGVAVFVGDNPARGGLVPAMLDIDAEGNTVLAVSGGAQHSTLGTAILAVGNGGKHATLKSALEYVAAQVGMVEVGGFTGTVTATRYSDTLVGVGTNFLSLLPGDLIRVAGDTNTYNTQVNHVVNQALSDTSLIMQEGFIGATGAGKAYTVWRSNKFNIVLVDECDTSGFTSNILLPDGANVSISGIGNCPYIHNGSYAFKYGRSGYFSFGKLNVLNNNGSSLFNMDRSGQPFGGTTANGFGRLSVSDIFLQSPRVHGGNSFILEGGFANLQNITGSGKGGVANIITDGCQFSNIQFEIGNGTSDGMVVTNPVNAAFSTKKMYISSLRFNRKQTQAAMGAGACLEVQDIASNKEVFLRDIVIVDENQPSANENCLVLAGQDSATGVKVYFEGGVINNTGLGAGISIGEGTTAYTRNVHNGIGGACDIVLSGVGATHTPY